MSVRTMNTNNNNNIKVSELENSQTKDRSFFLDSGVDKYRNLALKTRLKTLIYAKGLKESTFYKSIGLSKDNWYRLSWGKQECPLDIKVRIAQALGVDSSVIWQEEVK